MGGNLHAERLEGGWKQLLQGEPEPFKRIRSDLQTLLPEAGTKTPSQRGSRAPSSSQTWARNSLKQPGLLSLAASDLCFTACQISIPIKRCSTGSFPPPFFFPHFSLITDTVRTTKRNSKDGLRGGITAKSVFKCQ